MERCIYFNSIKYDNVGGEVGDVFEKTDVSAVCAVRTKKTDYSLYDIIKHTDFHVMCQTINMLKDVYKTLCFSLS